MEIVKKVYAIDIAPFFTPAQTFPTIGSLVSVIVPNLFIIAGIGFFIMIILAGLKFINSAGKDPTELTKARDHLAAAVVGLLIVFLSYFVILIIEKLTGITILNSTV